LTLTAAQ